MKKSNKKIIIILTIVIALLIICFFILFKTNAIENLQKAFNGNSKAEEENNLSYMLIDNIGDKLKLLVNVKNSNGIKSVEYETTTGDIVKLDCNNRQVIAIDLDAEIEKDYDFKIVTSDNVQKTEKINIPTNYLNSYFTIEDLPDESTETVNKININYITDQPDENIRYYYKIGKSNSSWAQATSTIFPINLEVSHIEDFTTLDTTICVKQIDDYGGVIYQEFKHDVPLKGDFNVFTNNIVLGKTVQQYGFTASTSGAEAYAFTIGNFTVGHSTGYSTFAGNFRLFWTNIKQLKPTSITVGYYFCATYGRYNSIVGSTTTAYYTDGTNTSTALGQASYGSWTTKNVTLTTDSSKQINYLQMYINGTDKDYTWAQGRVTSIILNGIDLTPTD